MKEKDLIIAKRMLEIEEMLKKNKNLDLYSDEFEYFMLARRMPIEEIKEFINLYDNSRPKYDELRFIRILKTRYNETDKNIIKRIQQVRKIIKYEKIIQDRESFSKKIKK